MNGTQVWWADKVNRVVIYVLAAITLWGTTYWAGTYSVRRELAEAVSDINEIQNQASNIFRLQTAIDAQQDAITQRIDIRLDRIEGNTEVIKEVVVTRLQDTGATK